MEAPPSSDVKMKRKEFRLRSFFKVTGPLIGMLMIYGGKERSFKR